jgi:protoheme ferro-lyase
LLLNISIALTVFMGLAGGGMLSLILMANRRQQTLITLMLVGVMLLALAGLGVSAILIENVAAGLTNGAVLFVLSFALGYSLTTFSVLSPGKSRRVVNAPGRQTGRTAVICLSQGEPPEYDVRSAVRRFELTDDQQEAPLLLLRPFYMRDLKSKYAAIGGSPYKGYQTELAAQVQARLDSSYRVYSAFYSDVPGYAEQVCNAIEDGASRIVVVHVRVTEPPDAVRLGDVLEGLNPESYGVQMAQIGPLSDSALLPQLYVRRVLEVLPHVDAHADDIGLLLVGRGNAAKGQPAEVRREQEEKFQQRVRQALAEAGFDERRIVIGWLRNPPVVAEALRSLVGLGCKSVYWMPSSYPADGVNTLYDMPAQMNSFAREHGVKLVALGAWNGDELAAEEIAVRVRAATRMPAGRSL